MNATTPAAVLALPGATSCIHCGLCLSACPTYLESGNENDSPRGRIHLMRALKENRLQGAGSTLRHLDLCLGCRACEAACPSGVPYGELIEETRDHLEQHSRRPLFQRFLRRVLIERVFPNPTLLRLALQPAMWLKRAQAEHLLPRFAREALALVPESTLPAHSLPEQAPASRAGHRGRVGLISGCVMSVLFHRTHANTLRLINAAGFDAVIPRAQTCCGALFAHGGNLAEARARARINIAAFEALQLDAVIVNAAGCGSTLKEYGHLLAADRQWHARAQAFAAKIVDLSEWLVRAELPAVLKTGARARGTPRAGALPSRVTFHDACHLAHAQRITAPPRQLVREVAGDRLVELAEADVCCGSAGSYNLTEPEMAARLQRRKVENILASGAQCVVSTNPGCLMQIEAGLRQRGAAGIRAVHLADFLAETLLDPPSQAAPAPR